MRYLKERKLAQEVLKRKLGFAPKMEDIIPLESGVDNGVCHYVMFTIRHAENIVYRAGIHIFNAKVTIENSWLEIEFHKDCLEETHTEITVR